MKYIAILILLTPIFAYSQNYQWNYQIDTNVYFSTIPDNGGGLLIQVPEKNGGYIYLNLNKRNSIALYNALFDCRKYLIQYDSITKANNVSDYEKPILALTQIFGFFRDKEIINNNIEIKEGDKKGKAVYNDGKWGTGTLNCKYIVENGVSYIEILSSHIKEIDRNIHHLINTNIPFSDGILLKFKNPDDITSMMKAIDWDETYMKYKKDKKGKREAYKELDKLYDK